jgi:hypothetical protein
MVVDGALPRSRLADLPYRLPLSAQYPDRPAVTSLLR